MKKYILATDYDDEGFDYDGAGDYFYTATNYDEHDSKEEILTSLKKNIYYECRKKKPNFNSIEEYCKEFGFRLYERKI